VILGLVGVVRSRLEEAERLSVGGEFVECVASALEIGTEIRECVAAADTSMPTCPLRATERKGSGIEESDQCRTRDPQQRRRGFGREIALRGLQLHDRLLERLHHFRSELQLTPGPANKARVVRQRVSDLVQRRSRSSGPCHTDRVSLLRTNRKLVRKRPNCQDGPRGEPAAVDDDAARIAACNLAMVGMHPAELLELRGEPRGRAAKPEY
jgi:hypothetical protein